MAMITKTDKGSKWGQFAATAVQALGNIPNDIQEWKRKEADHKMRLESFEQNKKLVAAQIDESNLKVQDIYGKKADNTLLTMLQSKDRKKAWALYGKDFMNATSKAGRNADPVEMENFLMNAGPEFDTNSELYSKNAQIAYRADGQTINRKAFDTAMNMATKAVEDNIKLAPDAIKPHFIGMKDELLKAAAKSADRINEWETNVNKNLTEQDKNKNKPVALTPGQEALDKKFGQDYAEYVAGGGSTVVAKSLAQLEKSLDTIDKQGNITGPVVGLVPDTLRKLTKGGAKAVAANDAVKEVVQRNLRLVFGPQFTQTEGEGLMKRAYDPQQPPAENKKRLRLLFDQIKDQAKIKEQAARWFEDHNGSLSGFKGQIFTSGADFDLGDAKDIQIKQDPNTGKKYEVNMKTKQIIREVP